MIPHLARRLRFEQLPMRRQRGDSGGPLAFQIHPSAGLDPVGRQRATVYIPRVLPARRVDRERPRRRALPGARKNRAAPNSITRARAPPPKRSSSAWSARAAACACSTNTTSRAPRDRASSPSAPEPANRSRQRVSTMSCCSQLNRVSRTRSGVGRSPGMSGKPTRRPRQAPPTMRTKFRLPGTGLSDLGVVTALIIPRGSRCGTLC